MYELIIIGAGPAGVSAAVYAARKRIKTLLLTEEVGGQSTVSEGVENWIGTVKIHGSELAKTFREHVEAYKGDIVTLTEGVRVEKLEKREGVFYVTDNAGKTHEAKSVLIASGAGRRKLEVSGAAQFENKGVVYCASCDGPLFSGQHVAVIGGGNAGFETALQLLAYCPEVTLISRGSDFRADPITVEKAREHEGLHLLTDTIPLGVEGEKFVTGLKVQNTKTNEEQTLSVSGIFVEIGVLPNTSYAKGVVEMDEFNRVITNAKNQRTSVDGVWAAGDCTDELYHQNNIAAGDGVKALEDIYLWLKHQ